MRILLVLLIILCNGCIPNRINGEIKKIEHKIDFKKDPTTKISTKGKEVIKEVEPWWKKYKILIIIGNVIAVIVALIFKTKKYISEGFFSRKKE